MLHKNATKKQFPASPQAALNPASWFSPAKFRKSNRSWTTPPSAINILKMHNGTWKMSDSTWKWTCATRSSQALHCKPRQGCPQHTSHGCHWWKFSGSTCQWRLVFCCPSCTWLFFSCEKNSQRGKKNSWGDPAGSALLREFCSTCSLLHRDWHSAEGLRTLGINKDFSTTPR